MTTNESDLDSRLSAYTIDAQHSNVQFAVRHMKVSFVRGRFLDIRGVLYVDEQTPSRSHVDVIIGAASIDTGLPERDEHLRSADFLNVRVFPHIRFVSTGVEVIEAGHWLLTGDLSVRGLTHQIVLDTTLEGRLVDLDGNERVGFSASTELNRRDFGMNWEGWMQHLVVGDTVAVTMDIEAMKHGGGSR